MKPFLTSCVVKVVGIYGVKVVGVDWVAIIREVEIMSDVERLFLLEILGLLNSVDDSTWFEINHITARVMLDYILVFNTSVVSHLVLLHSTAVGAV